MVEGEIVYGTISMFTIKCRPMNYVLKQKLSYLNFYVAIIEENNFRKNVFYTFLRQFIYFEFYGAIKMQEWK